MEFAAETGLHPAHGGESIDHGRHRAFHVSRAEAINSSIIHNGIKRIMFPLGAVAERFRIDMAVQNEGGFSPATAGFNQEIWSLRSTSDHLGGACAQELQFLLDSARHGAFISRRRRAGNRNQVARKLQQVRFF